ncbi:hypothetical protein [Moorena sp. SIO2C4]|uniref:hypothetical protein n=1 Tax=Moorena sp. SIO2C4 TaxID=2607824 RepID=UPI0013C850FD|nr:hypothetical protein [Moorena sp. SIO2C4]NES43403.1 hypothetical protein [Moorena sp. SIO2C4]NES86636.1 hypothetical protein [Moorena sp. SIO2B7]
MSKLGLSIFKALYERDAEIANLDKIECSQSNSLETVNTRIDEIKSCSSAIICLPLLEESSQQFQAIAYLDLGACLALFPQKTLLIYKAVVPPQGLKSKEVETFKFSGNLDFQTGMELYGKILKILKS